MTEPTAEELPPASPRSLTLSFATAASAVLLAVLGVLPLPYVVDAPGPTRDTLGRDSEGPLITISGATSYPSTGKLLLTTVSVFGGPGRSVDLGTVVRGWLSGSSSVMPVEAVFPRDETQQQLEQQSQADMVSSQENATVAALEEIGYAVPTTMTIVDVVDGTGAHGVVQKGDVLVAVNGTAVSSFSGLKRILDAIPAVSKLTLRVLRAGAPVDLSVTTTDDGTGTSLLGVLIDPTFALPVDVKIRIGDIGGPSAGTMFALGIIDKLTAADEANGVVIAGTGTMDLSGKVGPIGGIEQKMAGAVRDGATWFLAPADNCDEVAGHVPAGLHVARVATLHEARLAVQAIGADAAAAARTLPTCTSH